MTALSRVVLSRAVTTCTGRTNCGRAPARRPNGAEASAFTSRRCPDGWAAQSGGLSMVRQSYALALAAALTLAPMAAAMAQGAGGTGGTGGTTGGGVGGMS